MTTNRNTHKLLAYICEGMNEEKQMFASDRVAKVLNMDLGEVNTIFRDLEANGDAQEIGYQSLHDRGATGLLKTKATVDAFETGKYRKGWPKRIMESLQRAILSL